MPESKTEKRQVAIRLSKELLDQIERLANQEQRNRSNMIEYLLRKQLREFEEHRAIV
jgi:hypothetical protein